MTDVDCKLCGIVPMRNCVVEEKSLSPREGFIKKIVKKNSLIRKSRRELYNEYLSASSVYLSEVKPPQSLSDSQYTLRRRSKSPGTSKPLTSWPPIGYNKLQSLSPTKARELIATGAPVFRGHKLPISLGGNEYYHLFSTHYGNGEQKSDGRECGILEAASFRLQGPGAPVYPWETLEQPSMAFTFGSRPGTVTLNHWVNMGSRLDIRIKNFDIDTRPRDLTLAYIIKHLIDFERKDQDTDDMTRKKFHLNFQRLSELIIGPQKTAGTQINNLVKVLSRQSWIDFSRIGNQAIAKFFSNATYADKGRHKLFFHQLLLAIELELSIQDHDEEEQREIFRLIPEKVKWDIAVARIWRSNITIENSLMIEQNHRIQFHFLNKAKQLKKLYEFAKDLKWPTLSSLFTFFSSPLDDIEKYSPDAITFFSAVTLPGRTLPFLLMNSLIEIDPASNLTALMHVFPNTGFQYKGVTYWTSNCIIGKVVAPTCGETGGWIGPLRPATGLGRSQIARIHQRMPNRRLENEDVETLHERSLPLGPEAEQYPIKDYLLLKPDTKPDSIIDSIRIEKLSLCPVPSLPKIDNSIPQIFDAAVQFAINGMSWPLILRYDVSFISAPICTSGPHPLFYDYEHQVVRVDNMLKINDWVMRSGSNSHINLKLSSGYNLEKTSSGNIASETIVSPGIRGNTKNKGEDVYDEKVLVIEAFGVADNEVLARSWCAHWGLSALIADMQTTCMSCAIRESYAACINVLILIDSSLTKNNDN